MVVEREAAEAATERKLAARSDLEESLSRGPTAADGAPALALWGFQGTDDGDVRTIDAVLAVVGFHRSNPLPCVRARQFSVAASG